MKVSIDISDEYTDVTITVQAKEWTEELERLIKLIKSVQPPRIMAIDQDQTLILQPNEIDYVYAEQRKVFAVTRTDKYELRMKLFEVEDILEQYQFTRFSKSVVGNVDQIDRFELSFNGSLHVYFKSGNKEYVSRHYVSKLKDKIIGGGNQNAN